ncbi:MAG: ParB/RepB/Spo0J family partition protein [Oscillospiraceae bacterium]|nr:MAG: ParB/RepB/Spo0J family partition protein [Oscillospiraceae bacterium]
MNTKVTMIPVAQLHPHPDNPRKDLGDITELTASIKANGVLQNLTVVPRANPDVNYEELCRQYYGDPTEENRTKLNQFRSTDGYTVIIGHRRLAAAKAAGLMELPCIVVEDMTLEEQISTMMTENMQRSDLTVYEEAEGFQMMMDFGNSVEQVADKAGFSESTIRRRVKLLSLDREAFKKSVKRGATLADFALLDKLDTEEAKNEVLKSVGTNNFRACLDRALREQKDRKTMNAVREVVASYATKADSKADMPENCLFYASYGSWSRIAEAPADAGEHAYWYTESGYGITVYRERTEEDKPAEKTPEQLAREAKIEECCEKCRAIEEDEESAYRLRLNYLKEYGFPKKAAEAVTLAACRMMILNPDTLGDMDEDTIEAVYGEVIYDAEHELDTAELLEKAQENPMRMLMVLLFALTEPVNHWMHDIEWPDGFYKCIKENTFCLQCRFDRKKQAQRHWCRVNAKRGERP